MRLKTVVDDFIERTLITTVTALLLYARKSATHCDIVCFELRDDILAQTACAEAHPVAEVANPTTIVLTHVEVVIVAQFQTGMAKLAIAAILRLL